MSLPDPVLRYSLDSLELINVDLEGSSDAVNTGVTIVTDGTYGDVADFDGSSSVELSSSVPSALSGSNARTISMWINMDVLQNNVLFTQGNATGGGNFYQIKLGRNSGEELRFESHVNGILGDFSVTTSIGTWYNVVMTYNGTTTVGYLNGVQEGTLSESINTDTTIMNIGEKLSSVAGFGFNGQMLDFRVYDQALNSTQVATLHANGPEQGINLDVTLYTHAAEITWNQKVGATSYTLTIDGEAVVSDTTELTYTVYNLDDGVTYEIGLFSDLDSVDPLRTRSLSTPAVDETETGNILTFLSNDLTLISSERVDELDVHIQDNLTTGDEIVSRIEFGDTVRDDKIIKYVDNGATVGFEEIRKPILTPFVEGDGAKSFLLTKSDTLTETISYDGLGNVTVDGITYTAGDKFIFDGKVCKVAELN